MLASSTMTTIQKSAPKPALDKAGWASDVRNTARALELGMKTLTSLVQPDGKAPGGLFQATSQALHAGVELLSTLLKKRFDVSMSKTDLGMLDVAQRALQRADSKFYAMEKQADAARIPPGAQKFPSEWFGDVDNAAAKLAKAANDSGKAQYVDFNGTNLIALPGQSAKDVVNGWRDGTGLKNPLSGLQYEVESRKGDEVAKKDLAALAKTKPRSLSNVMADLESKKSYGAGAFMAGLCELKHPAEIKSFVEHFLENPPKPKDKEVTDAEARKTAIGNIRFWVNERGGAARGTEASWNKALDETISERAKGGGQPQAIKKAAPRTAQQILGDLQKLVSDKRYGHAFMAGLCELNNPADIKTFLNHFYEHPDKKDASTSTAEARDTMVKNTIFWIRDRGGGAPGTEKTWLDTLDAVVKEHAPKKLEFGTFGITNIDTVVAGMAKMAKDEGKAFSYDFNGTELVARPGDDAATIKKPFDDAMTAARAKYAEAQKVAAEKREGRMKNFVDGGGKIIDTPPAGMVFDKRALIAPRGFANSSDKPLQLITEAQLNQLPAGTQLTSISGEKAIKGVDSIDTDTRGGFIAYGFLQ